MEKRLASAILICVCVWQTACISISRRILLGAPDLTTPRGMRVYFDGLDAGVAVPYVSTRIDATLDACDTLCDGGGGSTNITNTQILEWRPNPFMCDKIPVHGCDYNQTIYIGEPQVIPDEIGHLCFAHCYSDNGESVLPDGGRLYEDRFIKFIEGVK